MGHIVGAAAAIGIVLVFLLVSIIIAYTEGKDDGHRARGWGGGTSRYDNGFWIPWSYVYDYGYKYGLANERGNLKKKNLQRFEKN